MSEHLSAIDRAIWATARTLEDAGELTARWLERRIEEHCCYYGGPDPETIPLVPVLARLNRAGFVTTASQPGGDGTGYDGARWQQRAAVEGFAGSYLAQRLQHAVIDAGLDYVLHAPGDLPWWRYRTDREMVVTLRDGEEYTWFGQHLSRRDIRSWRVGWGACHRDAVKALCSAWQVTLIDPEWGRESLLWDTLAALCPASEVPS